MHDSFYYADERTEAGGPMPGATAAAHAETYVKLAESKEQLEWQYTFVNGNGYKKF